jgi:hypothetical protein
MAHYEDLEIDQGASAKWQVQCLGPDGNIRDLSNFRARGSVKKSYETSDSDSLNFLVNIEAPPTSGVVTFSLNASQTSQLTRRRYVYDVEMEIQEDSDTTVERILEGKILVSRSVTNRVYYVDSDISPGQTRW